MFRVIIWSHGVYTLISKSGLAVDYDYTNNRLYLNSDLHYGLNQQWAFDTVSKTMESSAEYGNNNNYLTKVTDSRGNPTTYAYDVNKGLKTSETDTNGTTNYTYNSSDNISTVSKNGQTCSYNYANEKLSSITSPSNTIYNFAYDNFYRNTGISIGSRNLITNTYNSNNLLAGSTYGNGQSISLQYDNLNRLTSKTYSDNTKYSNVYNNDGNVVEKTECSGTDLIEKTNITYDLIKRPVQISSTRGQNIKFFYDSKNRVSEFTNNVSNSDLTTSYNYLDNGNIDRVKTIKQGAGYPIYINNSLDQLSRLSMKSVSMYNLAPYITKYEYFDGVNANTTTPLVKDMWNSTNKLSYEYDSNGNITKISQNGTVKVSYTYDNMNQLKRENNNDLGKTIVYGYNNGGNLRYKSEFPYTEGETGAPTKIYNYAYGDSSWKDLLTSFDGNAITYDNIGNPKTYYRNQMEFIWEKGRRLNKISFLKDGDTSKSDILFTYNEDGIRTSKAYKGSNTKFYLNGSNIVTQICGSDRLDFAYDQNGSLYGFYYNNTPYLYVKNAQNDIIGILDSNNSQVVTYTYDSWGKVISVGGSLASTVGQLNPFRYRGYYYDTETGFYYLNSRYYDPGMSRFINADDTGVLDEDQGSLIENNLFAYCLNNPVNMADEEGTIAWWIAAAIGGALFDSAIYCISAAARGNFSWKELGKTALIGAVTGVTFGAAGKVVKAASGAVKASKAIKSTKVVKQVNKVTKAVEGACFVSGTLIATKDGDKPIEQIKAGDYVCSENPETGEKSFKEVEQTFVNVTSMLVHVFVNDEEIKTTIEHPFWVVNKGWIGASHLQKGDYLKLQDGKEVPVTDIQVENLNETINVYNFEVEDFHTYFVGENSVLVHNICAQRFFNVSKQESKVWKGFRSVKGESYKFSGNGSKRKYFDWDHTHNDIEVYNSKGIHLGSMNPETGAMYKPAVKGRRLW